jgi:hypothetical protein
MNLIDLINPMKEKYPSLRNSIYAQARAKAIGYAQNVLLEIYGEVPEDPTSSEYHDREMMRESENWETWKQSAGLEDEDTNMDRFKECILVMLEVGPSIESVRGILPEEVAKYTAKGLDESITFLMDGATVSEDRVDKAETLFGKRGTARQIALDKEKARAQLDRFRPDIISMILVALDYHDCQDVNEPEWLLNAITKGIASQVASCERAYLSGKIDEAAVVALMADMDGLGAVC